MVFSYVSFWCKQEVLNTISCYRCFDMELYYRSLGPDGAAMVGKIEQYKEFRYSKGMFTEEVDRDARGPV